MKFTTNALLSLIIQLLMTVSWATENSTDINLTPVVPSTIVLMEMGFFEKPSDNNTEQHSFSTTKTCPVNFKPYVVIAPTRVWDNMNYRESLTGFGMCIQRLTVLSNNYSVTYLNSKRFMMLNDSWEQAKRDPNGANVYGSHSKAAFSNLTWEYIYYKSGQQAPTATYDDVRGINWKLYCYPPNINPPFLQVNAPDPTCQIGAPPF